MESSKCYHHIVCIIILNLIHLIGCSEFKVPFKMYAVSAAGLESLSSGPKVGTCHWALEFESYFNSNGIEPLQHFSCIYTYISTDEYGLYIDYIDTMLIHCCWIAVWKALTLPVETGGLNKQPVMVPSELFMSHNTGIMNTWSFYAGMFWNLKWCVGVTEEVNHYT